MANRFLISASLALLLAACGGGDDNGSAPPTGGGGPTPTPSPTPSPTPTYQTFATLTGNQAFATACGGTAGITIVPADGFGRSASGNTLVSLDFTAANSTWRVAGISVFGDSFDNSFGPSDIDAASPFTNFTDYLRDPGTGFRNRLLIGDKPISGVTREYVRQFVHVVRPTVNSTVNTYFCTYGIPTLLTDPLPTGTITYTSFRIVGQASVNGGPEAGAYDLGESIVTLSANPATGEVSTRLQLVGRLQTASGLSETRTDMGTFNGVARADGTRQNFFANLEGNRAIAGSSSFGGWFFGPQGREAAFGFAVQAAQPTGGQLLIAGSVTARR